jgi:hypothetical protein
MFLTEFITYWTPKNDDNIQWQIKQSTVKPHCTYTNISQEFFPHSSSKKWGGGVTL